MELRRGLKVICLQIIFLANGSAQTFDSLQVSLNETENFVLTGEGVRLLGINLTSESGLD